MFGNVLKLKLGDFTLHVSLGYHGSQYEFFAFTFLGKDVVSML